MELDIITIVCILLAVIVGAIIFKVLNSIEENKADMLLDKLQVYYDNYGPLLEKENPDLYRKVGNAIKCIEDAYSDSTISALEALQIASEFYPVFKEIAEYAKGKAPA